MLSTVDGYSHTYTVKQRIEHGMDLSPEEYDDFVLQKGRDIFAQAVRDLLGGIVGYQNTCKVLEVGAGTGIATKRLNELNHLQIIALDRRADFLQHAINQRRIGYTQAVIGDFSSLPFDDKSFDVYTGVAILNQRDDIDSFYHEVIRTTRSKGLILLPWVKTRTGSIDREREFFDKFSINTVEQGDWFLLGEAP